MAVENTVMAGYAVTKGDGVAMVLDITFQWEMRIFVGKKIASDLLKFILKLIQ